MRLLASLIPSALLAAAFGCGPDPTPAGVDEPLLPCAANYAGCGDGTPYTDMTDAGMVTISFGKSGNTYSPKCLKLKAGTTVTFAGSFTPHPLQQTCAPTDTRTITTTRSGGEAAFLLTDAGDLGYYCIAHGSKAGAGMAGAIQVIP